MSRQAIQRSIEHWKRMLQWARNMPPDAPAYAHHMLRGLGENWSGRYCALCAEVTDGCGNCDLAQAGQFCDDECSAYDKVRDSDFWGEWCKNAEEMIRVLESLLEET